MKHIPKHIVEHYYLSLNKSSFFEQTDDDLSKDYNYDIIQIKKLVFFELHTNIKFHQEISTMLNKCALFAKEYIEYTSSLTKTGNQQLS